MEKVVYQVSIAGEGTKSAILKSLQKMISDFSNTPKDLEKWVLEDSTLIADISWKDDE